MKPSVSFLIVIGSLVSILILAILKEDSWCYYIPGGLGLVASVILFRGVIKPGQTVAKGMELIRSQDFNNRLVKVGESNADRIVVLFNTMIDKLRAERLHNKEQEGLLSLLIDASPMGVAMLDFDNKITLLNSSFYKICGLSKEEKFIGRDFEEVGSDLIRELKNINLGENKIIKLDPSRVFRCYHLTFIQEGFSRRFYLIESLTEEIIKAERRGYEKVIRIISHEVNNTMGGLRTVLEMLSANENDKDTRRVIQSCDDRCEKLSGFINSYAEVVKLPEAEKRIIDLNNLMTDMIPFLRMITPDEIDLKYKQPDEKVEVKADGVLLQQAIVNIVKNAVESIEGTGKILITVGIKRGRPQIEVSNTGKRIEPEMEHELFSPFYTTKKNGKGIGLTLVKEIMIRHDAEYSLKTGEDGITRFEILFQIKMK